MLRRNDTIDTRSLDDVKQMIESGASVNGLGKLGITVFHEAVYSDNLDLVKLLVKNEANVNLKDFKDECIALQVAAEHGNVEIVKYLLENGADINHKNRQNGRNALHYAAMSGSLETVKCLVEHGANINSNTSFDETALHIAIEHSSLEIVRYLVEHGADITCKDGRNENAISSAVKHDSLKIVKYLVEHAQEIPSKSFPNSKALQIAARYGSLELIEYLIQHGSLQTVKYLLEQCKNSKYKKEVHSKCSLAFVKYFIDHDVGSDFQNKFLYLACETGNTVFVDFLLQRGAMRYINECSAYSRSPLSIACLNGHTEVVKLLLKYNVDVRRERELICGNEKIVNILKQEAKKSIKHKEKIKMLKEMDEEQLTKVAPPLRLFSADKTMSIGFGSKATFVYVGLTEDGREVAVKRTFTQACANTAENERMILSLINTKKSPFIVSYIHFFTDNTFMYLIIDLCEQTLKELVLSGYIHNQEERAPQMIKEILTGLEFLHAQGILHRDLKPSNVLVDVQGHMKLADFGISRVLSDNETTAYTDPKGTDGWMPPEVIETIDKGEKCGFKKKSDVHVAGMIASFILTKGEHPFGERLERMSNIVKGNPVNVKKLDSLAREFVLWLISYKIEERPYADEALEHSFMDKIFPFEDHFFPKVILPPDV